MSWSQIGDVLNGEAGNDYSGKSLSLSNDGNIVAIGAFGNDGNDRDAGHVRIYDYDSNTMSWSQIGGELNGEAAYDNFGNSVSLSSDGQIVAIGFYHSSENVRVYEYDSNTNIWSQIGGDINGGVPPGIIVSLSGDGYTIAIGARFDSANSAGRVRVYEYDSNTMSWTQIGDDLDGEGQYDESGSGVSLSDDGNIVAIGAYGNNGLSDFIQDAGHVRVYDKCGN
mmetsp:Transcript_28719/g.29067  ORF Transcript_28719/g.29067 Transcript_28719/m.29067 type:complete len:224 (-) Transcript_28719:26-697(-)